MRTNARVLICGSSQGEYGGIEAVMITLAEYLHSETPLTCTLAFKLVSEASLSTSLESFLSQSPVPFSVVKKLDWKLFQLIQRSDIVHTQNVPPDIVFIAKLLGKLLISTTHNYRNRRKSLHNLFWKFGNLLCDFVTFNSRFVAETWKTSPAYNRQHQVIPTVSKLPGSTEHSSSRAGFVFISRWIPNKGADLLIEAYERANIDKEKWPLVMMGDGPLREELESTIRDRNIKGITSLGRVSETVKFERIAAAKWLVVPPNTQEDMGLTPIEGRALGTPCIASMDGGVPESAGDQAIFFPPGDVETLRRCLEKVTQMDEKEYLARSKEAKASLKTYLRPQSVYVSFYRKHLPVTTHDGQVV